MFKVLFTMMVMIFFILLIGSLVLEEFPAVQPVWEEMKTIGGDLYESSMVKYGSVGTLILILGLAFLIGSSRV